MLLTCESLQPFLQLRYGGDGLELAVLCQANLASFLGDLETGPAVGGLDDGRAAGTELFSRYIVPFELLSVLLLGAIFGALVIARKDEEQP